MRLEMETALKCLQSDHALTKVNTISVKKKKQSIDIRNIKIIYIKKKNNVVGGACYQSPCMNTWQPTKTPYISIERGDSINIL